VLFVQSLGQIECTAARRISHPDALAFGELHRATFQEFGFRLIDLPALPVSERADLIDT
jgi:predicted ATPase